MKSGLAVSARAWRAFASVCLVSGVALLQACGGGGGGDDGSASGSSVSIAMTSPRSLEQSIDRDMETERFTIQAQVSGDASALSGKTIYVKVADSAQMFEPSTEIFVDSYTLQATIDIGGKPSTTAGDFSGTITVDVCYDAACTEPMKGSPLRVAYTVHVAEGLTVENLAPSYATPFGVNLANARVAVRLPDHVTRWGVGNRPEDGNLARQVAGAEAVEGADATHGVIEIDFKTLAPGTYTAAYLVSAWVPRSGNLADYEYAQEITITYTVRPNPSIDVWINPVSISVSHRQGEVPENQTSHGYEVVANTGVMLTTQGFEYLSEPPEAETSVLHNAWWDPLVQMDIPCFIYHDGTHDCLPAGQYSARLSFDPKSGS